MHLYWQYIIYYCNLIVHLITYIFLSFSQVSISTIEYILVGITFNSFSFVNNNEFRYSSQVIGNVLSSTPLFFCLIMVFIALIVYNVLVCFFLCNEIVSLASAPPKSFKTAELYAWQVFMKPDMLVFPIEIHL